MLLQALRSTRPSRNRALANMMFARQFKGVEVDDFSYLDQARENLQHNNYAIRYKTFQAMLEGLN